jgi:hypothetical protein
VLLYKVCFFTTPFEDPPGSAPNVLAILSARYTIPQSSAFTDRVLEIIRSCSEYVYAEVSEKKKLVGWCSYLFLFIFFFSAL